MIRLPVFGKDSLPHSSSRVLSLCATSFFWLILFLCAIFINPKKNQKVKYEIVKISLSPHDHYIPQITQEVQDIIDKMGGENGGEDASFQETSSIPQVEPTTIEPVVQTPKPQPVQKQVTPTTTPKTTPASTPKTQSTKQVEQIKTQTPQTVAPETSPIVSKSETVSQKTSTQTKKTYSEQDWEAMFAQSKTVSSSSQNTTSKVKESSSVSGAAATASANSTSTASASQPQNTSPASSSASQSTLNSLSQLANTTATGRAETKASIKTSKSNDGKTQIEFSDGVSRVLLYPSSTAISLSKDAQSLIETNREININFRVNENGYVIFIDLSNTAGISSIVLDEIKNQIKEWRFEQGSNMSDANFKLNIIRQ